MILLLPCIKKSHFTESKFALQNLIHWKTVTKEPEFKVLVKKKKKLYTQDHPKGVSTFHCGHSLDTGSVCKTSVHPLSFTSRAGGRRIVCWYRDLRARSVPWFDLSPLHPSPLTLKNGHSYTCYSIPLVFAPLRPLQEVRPTLDPRRVFSIGLLHPSSKGWTTL